MLNYVGFLDGIDFFKKDMKSHLFLTGWEVDGTSHHAALITVVPFVGPFLNLGFLSAIYPSSHNHGREKWVPPIVVTFQIQPFSTSTNMGERVLSHLVFFFFKSRPRDHKEQKCSRRRNGVASVVGSSNAQIQRSQCAKMYPRWTKSLKMRQNWNDFTQ